MSPDSEAGPDQGARQTPTTDQEAELGRIVRRATDRRRPKRRWFAPRIRPSTHRRSHRAYCVDCDWEDPNGHTTARDARQHAGRTGHRVFVRIHEEYELHPTRYDHLVRRQRARRAARR